MLSKVNIIDFSKYEECQKAAATFDFTKNFALSFFKVFKRIRLIELTPDWFTFALGYKWRQLVRRQI